MTGLAGPIPTRLPDGSIGVLSQSVPVRLVLVSEDPDTGARQWQIPAEHWLPGACIHIEALPPGDTLIYPTPPKGHRWNR